MSTNGSTQQFLAAAEREDARSTGRWLTSNDALDWTNTAINALATVADGISVPYLKLAAELTKQVIEVIQVRMIYTPIQNSKTKELLCATPQTVRENKSSALELGQQTFEYTRIIIVMYKGSENQELRPFDANVEQFNETLEEVLGILKKIALRRLVKRVVRHQKDKRRISDAKSKLEHAFRRFDLANGMIMVQDMQEIQVTTQETRAQTIDIARAIPTIQENLRVLVQDSARIETNLGTDILQTSMGIDAVQIQLDTITCRVEQGFEHMRRDVHEGGRRIEAYVGQTIEQTQGRIQQVAYS
ncbi:hypothetical protein EIP86_003426 [Pleurotus ostreatoroseus]|nr:hypothetical protein EIP86_003426 [Pleurotus ostreatoroseus]